MVQVLHRRLVHAIHYLETAINNHHKQAGGVIRLEKIGDIK